MTGYLCPKGHESFEADFCSVCGAKVQAAVAVAPPTTLCPDCGAAHEPASGIFCEICGYNFNTAAHGAPKSTVPAPTTAPLPSELPAPHAWGVLIEIDPSLKAPE